MALKSLKISCPDFIDGKKIQLKYTGRGENISPEILLEDLSPGAKTLAVTLEDVSHPIKNFTHWVAWNLPADGRIPGGLPGGKNVRSPVPAQQGVAYGLHRYAGPKPPRGKTHVYRLTVYALDTRLEISSRYTKRSFLRKAEGHILQTGSITGAFE